jgi:hypothetical protein
MNFKYSGYSQKKPFDNKVIYYDNERNPIFYSIKETPFMHSNSFYLMNGQPMGKSEYTSNGYKYYDCNDNYMGCSNFDNSGKNLIYFNRSNQIIGTSKLKSDGNRSYYGETLPHLMKRSIILKTKKQISSKLYSSNSSIGSFGMNL